MEICAGTGTSLMADTAPSSPAQQQESPPRQLSRPTPEPRKRVRRWHHRGFTGCSTCRRRHVRCDEASPVCKNCTRLRVECDGTQGRITFKVYGPAQTQCSPHAPKRRKMTCRKSDTTSAMVDAAKTEDQEWCEAVVVSPTTPSSVNQFRFQEPITPPDCLPMSIQCTDERYFTHFVDSVSSLLIIYDHAININPYRSWFPDFARKSPSMVNAMQALGALHLANTSMGQQRNTHLQTAMGKYGEVVTMFRTRYTDRSQQVGMTDFATCLLLCLYEMMDSQHHNWAVHLKGAREIYNRLFYPSPNGSSCEAQRIAETNHPLRSFLVSLLSYLDVAGACAIPGGTVVEGNYWKALSGGWEYNLGTPSLSPSSVPDNPRLFELRQSWAAMMEIQAAISTFAKDKSSMPPAQQDEMYKELFYRLVAWRAETPMSLQVLGELDDDTLHQYPFPGVLEYAGCIEAYEKATFVHLHQIAGAGRRGWISDRTYLNTLVSRVIALVRKLSKDVSQLAVLWPLFIAGQETRDDGEQTYVRETMQNLRRFGFKNVDCALEALEKIWFKRRVFPEGWTEALDEVQSNILIP